MSPRDEATVAFIGFGRVASAFAGRLSGNGVRLRAYDTNLDRPGGLARLLVRARGAAVDFLPVQDAVTRAQLVMSLVPPAAAIHAAPAAAPYLSATQLYVDATSVGARVKLEIERMMMAAGVGFVEAVILDAVDTAGADTQLRLCGDHGTG